MPDPQSATSEATKSVDPVPSRWPPVSIALGVRDAEAALSFYREAFGATEVMRLEDAAGGILHAELDLDGCLLMLGEESAEEGNYSPHNLGGTPVRMHRYVEDVDEAVARAVDAGAELTVPVEDQFYGDRAGRLRDPFGHVWIFASRQENLSADEIRERALTLLGGG